MADYDMLNEQQQKGMFTTEGPVLILAGAGSGKTRVLTHRAAYLLEEKGVSPYHILAITFTNKAAGEMRERISKMVEYGGDAVWVSTFHALCVRILRRYIDRLGYDTNFTIYDADDQKTLMKDICKRLEIDTKIHKEKMFLNAISSAKDELIDPVEFDMRAAGDYNKRRQAEVYREYQNALRLNNALDFDDLLFKTVELFQLDKEVLSSYQERFRYIMVDEYQDTNTAQFELIRLLAMKYKNLCVVGDDDQSIYRFRGANIYNILNFEQHFPEAVVIKLEQNYRSTQNILDAANNVISNNVGRKEKVLWTDNGEGAKIRFEQLENGYEEADIVARDIAIRVQRDGYQYKDCAVLYRTNAQSRLFEERFLISNIPYRIVGGVNFYSRKEVKDLLCYLKTIDNGRDELAVRRILNVPKRGIGAATIGRVADYSDRHSISFYEALCRAAEIPGIGKANVKIASFVSLIGSMRKLSKEISVSELLEEIINQTGYTKELEAEGTDEALSRIENIDELLSKAVSYEQEAEEPSLSGFLEEVALVADIDSLEENSDYVVLMTLHSAKGLEFSNVYMVGMEDGLFPSRMAITGDDAPAELEEERRLAYVGITRAKENLTITSARMRMLRGETHYGTVSRFVKEIPETLLQGKIFEAKSREEPRDESAYQKARRTFRTNATSYSETAGESLYFRTGRMPGENSGMFQTGGAADGSSASSRTVKRTPVRYTPVGNQHSFASDNTRKQTLPYGVGDRVRHVKFGEGEVKAVIEGGRDYEVTVDFDKTGTKKMFASFAKLKKI